MLKTALEKQVCVILHSVELSIRLIVLFIGVLGYFPSLLCTVNLKNCKYVNRIKKI